MGMVKRWLEELSVEMGLDGEITEEVLAEGERQPPPRLRHREGTVFEEEDNRDRRDTEQGI